MTPVLSVCCPWLVPAASLSCHEDGLDVILKSRDAVLAKVKDPMSFESYKDRWNSKVSSGEELFPAEVLEKAVEKSSKVLHDEAIRKAGTCNRPSTRGKKLHFSTMPCQQQCSRRQHSKKSTGSSSGSSFCASLSMSSSSKAYSSSSRQGKGKKF